MSTTAENEFDTKVRVIQTEVIKQTASWKVFLVVLLHPLDFTLVIRKYIGGSIQGNVLLIAQRFVDEKPSAVSPDLVQVDSDDGDGEFTDTLHMTRAHYDATFRGIGGIISPWGVKTLV